jgi:hypothetical protein
MAAPTINMKNGKTRSVGVHPFHAECFNGGYTKLQLPGLFTTIIRATVNPRNTSSATSLFVLSIDLSNEYFESYDKY